MRTRRQRHDDAHFPLQGKGAQGSKRKDRAPIPIGAWRVCNVKDERRGTHWRKFEADNSRPATQEELTAT